MSAPGLARPCALIPKLAPCPSSSFSFPCHRWALLAEPGGEQGTSSSTRLPEITAPAASFPAAPGDPKPSLQDAAPDPLAVPMPPAPAQGQLEAGGGSRSWRSSSRFAERHEGADAFQGAISKHTGAVRENRGVGPVCAPTPPGFSARSFPPLPVLLP